MEKIIYIFLIAFGSLTSFSQSEGLSISHLKGDFYVFTTYKSFDNKPMSANGMYIVSDSGVVLFDTPWDTLQFQPLLDTIKSNHGKDVVLCISTHSHKDRTAGLDYYKSLGIKTYTTVQTDSISKKWGEPTADFLMHSDTTFTMGQYSFETYFPGHGHTEDNIVIWIGGENILYGGCIVKSSESNDLGYIGEANIESWILAIKELMKRYKNPEFIITGHQNWTNKKSLKHTLNLLKKNTTSIN